MGWLQWLAVAARAGERDAWDALYDAVLAESIDGDPLESEARFNELVQGFPSEHQVHEEAVYRLALARWVHGEIDDARLTALAGIQVGSCRVACQDLVARIDLDRAAIHSAPVTWDFSGDHGVFHPWIHADRGSIQTRQTDASGDMELVWTTVVSVRASDELVFAFADPMPAPGRIRFSVRSANMEAWLRLWAQDDAGREYVIGSSIQVPIDASTEVSVSLLDARPLDGRPEPLDPTRLSRVWIRDTTHLSGSGFGPNTLFIDDLVID